MPARSFASRLVPLALLLAVPACQKAGSTAAGTGGSSTSAVAKAAKGTPLAKVGSDVITVEQFRKALDRQSPFLRARYNTEARKKEFLDNMIRFELLAQEAKKEGLEQDPDVQETLKKVMVQKLIAKQFRPAQDQPISVDKLKAFYDAHKTDYVKPERVRVAHIFVAFKAGDAKSVAAARKKAAKLLQEVRAQKTDPRAFQTIAREKSDDVASRPVGGDLLYLSQAELTQKWSAPMAAAAFAMKKVGEISGLVKGTKGYHILRLTGREAPLNRTLGEVKANIEARIRQTDRRQRYEDFVAGLRKASGVKVYDDELKKVDIGTSGVGHPGMISPHGMPMKAAHGH